MFRRLPHTLPADPVFEADLEKLGFHINDEDLVRSIRSPQRRYQYAINRNDRWNQVYRGANNDANRKIIKDRLLGLGLESVRLPLGAAANENHVPIYVSKDIVSKDRVIIIFGERNIDPDILSWRVIGEDGIGHGSLIELVKAVLSTPVAVTTPAHTSTKTESSIDQTTASTTKTSAPGIIIANPAQLLWYRGGSRAVSIQGWDCLPRPTAVHDAPRVDAVKNRIPGNRDYVEHVHYIFDKVIPNLLKKEAKIDIIGVEYTGKAAIEYLYENWQNWSTRIVGIALISPQHKLADLIAADTPSAFINFISKRCRSYFVSASSIETPIVGREEHGCNCYASGEHHYQESAFARSWKYILDWLNMLHVNPGYEEVEFEVVERDEEVKLGW